MTGARRTETLTVSLPPGTAADIHRLLRDAAKYHDDERETTNAFIIRAIHREVARRTKLRALVDQAVLAGDVNAANNDLDEWLADVGEECAGYVVYGAEEILNPKPADED